MKSSLHLPNAALVGLARRARGHGRRPTATLLTVLGSLAIHGVAYTALAALDPTPPAPQPLSELAFTVLAPAPEEPPPVEPEPEVTPPEPEPEVVAARPALRRAPEPDEPRPVQPPEDEELGEPDAEPEQPEVDPALQAIEPESSVETGLAVAGGAPGHGKAASEGTDRVNRAGSGEGAGHAAPRPGVSKVDLNVLAKRWMREVSAAINRSAARDYPRAARRARLQGEVWVTLEVDVAGHVRRAALKRSSGHTTLDEAALAAVNHLNQVPAPPGALHAFLRPVAVPIRYRLQ